MSETDNDEELRAAASEPSARPPVGSSEAELIELRTKAERFDLAMSVANDGMYDWDVRTGEIFFDSRYYTMAGYEPYEFPGTFQEWVRRVDVDDYERVDVAVKAYLDGTAEQYDEEFRFLRKDGEWMWIRARVKVVERDGDGAAVRVIGTHSDITEQKRAEHNGIVLEAQLREAQKREAIGRLAGGIAHDFNNMLCAIICSADLAKMELERGESVSRSLDQITEAAGRAAKLTRQLLAFSRKQVIEPRVLDLSELTAGIFPMLRHLVGEGATLRKSLVGDLGWVRVDPGQIEQVIVNLVINARDAVSSGGEIVIETANVSLDQARGHTGAGDYVVLAVADNGVGMDDETQAMAFEPFFSTKPEDRGTGLGLATALGIVEQHGGHIEVESTPGDGARFALFFPRVHEQADAPAPASPILVIEGKETVLVVEDDIVLRSVAIGTLRKLGYEVLSAASGDEAVRAADQHDGPIDLLLTDVIMPQMNGRELASILTGTRPGLEVLYTSGYSHEVIARRGVLDEGLHFLPKPYSVNSLARSIRKVLDSLAG